MNDNISLCIQQKCMKYNALTSSLARNNQNMSHLIKKDIVANIILFRYNLKGEFLVDHNST